MVFRLKVTLNGIKGFYRIYHVHGATTLYTLHKQLRADMEFPQDQLIMFKALAEDGSVTGRYGLFDLGSGTVDAVSLEKAVKAGAASFVYFYDVTNRKSVNISVEEDSMEQIKQKLAQYCGVSEDEISKLTILKKSIDARKKPEVWIVYTLAFSCGSNEAKVQKRLQKKKKLR